MQHANSQLTMPLLEASGVTKVFSATGSAGGGFLSRLMRKRQVNLRAVNGVDLKIRKGEVVGLVGESGCGKSTLARLFAGIRSPSSGKILHGGQDLAALSRDDTVAHKLKTQMIFQDPYSSLNPRMRVADIILEAPRLHGLVRGNEADFVDEQLRRTGLDPTFKLRYPHQFSGGQRQRIVIARALAVQPEALICDEPVSALDVSVQAQVLNLFMQLREQLGLTYLFISHDLGVVNHVSDRVVIMYLGRIVEEAPTQELFDSPAHPYTRALLADMHRIDTRRRTFAPLQGELPNPADPPTGCAFHPRCPHVMPRCHDEIPELRTVSPGHRSACHLNNPL